jgi:DNA-binding CsgD family transcriptional regulator
MQVTAQGRERFKAPEDPHSWDTPEAIAEAQSTLNALSAAATPRERQILSLLAQGYSDDEVATALGCQPSVVYTNRYRLQKKLPH